MIITNIFFTFYSLTKFLISFIITIHSHKTILAKKISTQAQFAKMVNLNQQTNEMKINN